MTYLDTNVFIYDVGNDDQKSKICIEIRKKVLKKEIKGETSLLTWDEFIHGVRKQYGGSVAIEEGKKFLKFPNLLFLEVDKNIISKAQELMEQYNLRPRDAIHAASALINGINEIISDDSDFDKVKELKRIKLEDYEKDG